MKRPQGFDPRPPEDAARRPAATAAANTKTPSTPTTPTAAGMSAAKAAPTAAAKSKTAATKPPARGRIRIPRLSTARTADVEARKQLRGAKRERKRFEREEVRRFTRRTRRRKAGWITAASVVAVMGGLLVTAVYSPLLALTTVQVEGASRIPPEEIVSVLGDQVGTPLPLLDFGRVRDDLGEFPLIQSYSTESRPPSTLVVRIVERTPVAAMATGEGFALLDPAGVVIDRPTERPAGYPLIDIGESDTSSGRFDAAAEVLVALPPEFLGQVDTVTATTKDDVSLVLTDGKRVVWGSSDASRVKAARLPALIAATADRPVAEYDVSSPDNLVVR